MIRFGHILILFWLMVGSSFTSAEYLREDDLKTLVISCYLENEIPAFCSKQQIDKPHIKIYLPLFKSVMIDEKIHAFRIMAAIENLSGKNIVGAKIRLNSRAQNINIIEFIISERVKYKMVSSTNYSHLIRSDVPIVRQAYKILHSAYYNADISDFEMAVTELYFD